MKKRTILTIAIPLITLHIVVFALLVFPKGKKEVPVAPAPPPPTAATQPAVGAQQPLAFAGTEPLRPPVPPPASENRDGYLRSDRPDRRTATVYAKLWSDPCQGAIVVDANTGKILFEERASAYAYPASVTKLMTLLIVLDRVQENKIRLTDMVAIPKEACSIGGSQIFLDQRESFTIDDLLYALIVQSANDAAAALAIHVAGSTEAFVAQMNAKARELGMNATTYQSPHGLPPGSGKQADISTAYDIALLCRAVLRHKETLRYTSTQLHYLSAPVRAKDHYKIMLATHNPHIKGNSYAGADGLKTGYHSSGGWSITATAERNGQRIISVVLGSVDKKTRDATSLKLLDKGFALLPRPAAP